jgi:hypothetical protein
MTGNPGWQYPSQKPKTPKNTRHNPFFHIARGIILMTELRRLTRLLVTSMMTWLWIALLVRTVIALKWDGIDSGFEQISTFAGYVILFSGFEVFSTRSSYPLSPVC